MRAPIIPPRPKVHERDLPAWKLLFAVGRNSIGFYPKRAFEELICKSSGLGIESALVSDPEGVRHVLGAQGAMRYRRPTSFIRIARPLVGQGLFLAEGETWKAQRKSLAPLFTPKALEHLVPHFQAASATLVESLKGQGTVNLAQSFQSATLDAVLRALFSIPPSSAQDGMTALMCEYIDGPGRLTPLDGLAKDEHDFAFLGGGRRRFSKARAEAVGKLIAARRANPHSEGERDLLDLLMSARDGETGEPLPDDEIGAQATTFIFAGFETTARLLFWSTYLLSLDQAEQRAIREEVLAFHPDRVTELSDLQNWPRLRRALLEAMRLYPPAPNMVRKAVEPDVICGVPINTGTRVWISPWVIHRHKQLWREPDAFIPDRFIDQPNPWNTNPAYIPFGTGPRVCIGGAFAMAEAQILLAHLLSRFEVSMAAGEPVMPKASITIAVASEPPFALKPVA
jgi:cytochrome P450